MACTSGKMAATAPGTSNRLQASAYLAAVRSVLPSPLPPIRIGGCGRYREFGELSGRTIW
jgi:hypothetical protein